MKTAAEYRAMADECFEWARDAKTDKVRASYLQLAQVWLDAASKLDGLPPPERRQLKKMQLKQRVRLARADYPEQSD